MSPADPATLNAALATVRRIMTSLHDFPWESPEWILAREFVRLLDAGELVRVRGLEWVRDEMGWKAEAPPIGDLHVWSNPKIRQWFLSVGSSGGPCKSDDEGKQLAEEFYREWMAKGLEPLLPEVRT